MDIQSNRPFDRLTRLLAEPGPADPRVLRFGEMPAVVYSEILGDLKAIIATKPQ